MVKVRSVGWRDEAWEIHFEIHEGVYRLDDYPVRITHLGRSEAEQYINDVATVATGLLRMHMRRGAVPPHAVVINWGRVVRLSQGGPAEVVEAIRRIRHSAGEEVESTVSQQF
ncbi:MAG: hypothetical protein C7B45_09120 [Sulfobacillus acidophilus]|uniref:Uncharacterized protein n=1 Tax=Sulfobacillus acidophilus TaxID=53633 RepID=A0A2T2WHW8_9FIRM|nr:MAG: hypothetical protein C7B45_09120 [Sulfobacillus acidophilus]